MLPGSVVAWFSCCLVQSCIMRITSDMTEAMGTSHLRTK